MTEQKEQKEQFEEIVCEVILFDSEDVITTSGLFDDGFMD